jgi:hypothetical protein
LLAHLLTSFLGILYPLAKGVTQDGRELHATRGAILRVAQDHLGAIDVDVLRFYVAGFLDAGACEGKQQQCGGEPEITVRQHGLKPVVLA